MNEGERKINEHFLNKIENSEKKNETVTALLSYSKNEYLKLIPFFKTKKKKVRSSKDGEPDLGMK